MKAMAITRAMAAIILIVAMFMIFPILVALIEGTPEHIMAFVWPAAAAILASSGILLATWNHRGDINPKSGFLLVTLGWIAVSAVSALPFVIGGAIPSYTDAFFETMSGFTTTGASILTAIENVPRPFLFWRSLTHWLGGMGIVVLAVALFPLLGIGGLQLMKAEAPGPDVDRLTSRITGTAKILWLIYLGMTVLETAMLMFGGMDLFDALTHTFGTLATGGFSPKNASVGHYSSPYLQNVITLFMVLAGTNFIMHYRLLTGRFKLLWQNSELKAYLGIFFVTALIMAVNLYRQNVYGSFPTALRYAGFQTASILTTTGFATDDFALWPGLSKALILAVMFIGGCAGSTGGGPKVVRIIALLKQGFTEMKYLLHPRSIFTVKLNGSRLRKSVVYTIAGFIILYMFFLILTTIVVSTGGYDLETSFSTALVTLGNIGPGFGLVGPTENYFFFSDPIKWYLSFIMMLGRLEIYTVLVVFSPQFWKR